MHARAGLLAVLALGACLAGPPAAFGAPPNQPTLDNNTVQENKSVGTVVGTLSTTDPDPGETFKYVLVAGDGDTGNTRFKIVGDKLTTRAVFDFETQASYSIRVRVEDSHGERNRSVFAIQITNDPADDPTHKPSSLSLSNPTIAENQAPDTPVGTLSATDVDPGDTFAYKLVAGGVGAADNTRFRVVGDELRTKVPLDHEAKPTLSVRVQVADSQGHQLPKVFALTVTDNNDSPTDISLSNASVAENQPSGTTVGTINVTDQDAGDTQTLTLVSGTGSDDNGSFTIDGSTLKTNAVFDFETDSSYSIRIQTDDGAGGTFQKAFVISVTDANDAPTDLALSADSVAENQPASTEVGTLSSTDSDAGDSFTYMLVLGEGADDNGSFQIAGDKLQTSEPLDFEAKSSYTVRVQTDDGNGGTFQKAFVISATDVAEAPTDLSLSPSSVAENQPAGTEVGTLSTTDQDAGDSFTYTLVSGSGDDDNGSFQVVGDKLQTNAVFDYETKNSYTVRVQTEDANGATFAEQLTITVTDANDAPTDVSLSASSVAENQPSGTEVGTLSGTDQDAGDSFTYTLVSGTGDDDNGSFQISGDKLQTNAVFNFEAKSSYSVRVQVDDGNGGTFAKALTITITDVNDVPTNIMLSPASGVPENEPVGTVVGTLVTTDQDVGDTFTYILVSGTGSDDNASFQIAGNKLQTNAVFDYETKSSYTVRVKTDDGNGGTFEKAFTIPVTDVFENLPPTDISLSQSSVAENQSANTVVGTLSTTDPNPGQNFSYTLVSGAGDDDNASFQISSDKLKTNAVFDYETKNSYTVRLQTDDGHGGTFAEQLTITVTDVNEAPTNVSLSPSSVAENQPEGTEVGTLSATDPDAGDAFTYTLVSGNGAGDNGSFQIVGDKLQTNAIFNFETKSSYSVRVQADDGNGGTFAKALAITVTNVNEAPTNVVLSPLSGVAENQPVGTQVGTLSTTDPDAGNTFTYTLVSGTGSDDNGSFQIVGDKLQTNAVFDYETKNSYTVRVQTDDGHGGTFSKALTIAVSDVNENFAPTNIALSPSSIAENQPVATQVGTLTTTDANAGDTFTYTLVSGMGANDNGSFQIAGDKLQTNAVFDFEAKSSYSVRVKTDDGHGGTFEKALTITITDVNDTNQAPTNIALSPSSVAENQPVATQVGTLTTTDANAGDTFTYTLVSGSGAGDNGSFQIAGDKLQTKAVFDFETKSSYSVRVRTTDSGNATFEKVFTITITDAVDSYTIGGSVSTLSGTGLVLRNNGGDNKTITANGVYTFATPVASGQPYLVTVFTQPTSPWQTCTVSNGSGTVANANVTNANVSCTTNTYTVGGNVSGLTGTGLQLRNNNGNTTSISGNGAFTFSTQIASGQTYNVTVFKDPSGQTCTVGSGSGTITSSNVTNVTIACS